MDMAVANLFKHKIRFELDREVTEQYEPHTYRKGRYYVSANIDNAGSIGVNDASDLCTTLLKPFILHTISTVVHEEEEIPIDDIIVEVVLTELDGEYEDYELVYYHLDNPYSSEVNSDINNYTFPEHVLNEPFNICVNVYCYFISDELRDFQLRQELGIDFRDGNNNRTEPIPPPVESYRQEMRYLLRIYSEYLVSRLHAYRRLRILRR